MSTKKTATKKTAVKTDKPAKAVKTVKAAKAVKAPKLEKAVKSAKAVKALKPAKKAVKAAKRAKAVKPVKETEEFADPTLVILEKCFKALDDKKAENLKVLDMRGKSPITNYFILATATSEPHLKALSGELDKTLKELGIKAVGRDFTAGSGWVVVDGFDFMAHIFMRAQRDAYRLESLWKDAEEIKFLA